MESFEAIVATLLRAEGYWVSQSYKVNLTKSDKSALNRPTMPRSELDVLAYSVKSNTLILVEVKSFFDSVGVSYSDLSREDYRGGRYKLFTWKYYRDIVEKKLVKELECAGLIASDATVTLGLAAGKVKRGDEEKIAHLMALNDWKYWAPKDIKQKLKALANAPYENSVIHYAAKILTNIPT